MKVLVKGVYDISPWVGFVGLNSFKGYELILCVVNDWGYFVNLLCKWILSDFRQKSNSKVVLNLGKRGSISVNWVRHSVEQVHGSSWIPRGIHKVT